MPFYIERSRVGEKLEKFCIISLNWMHKNLIFAIQWIVEYKGKLLDNFLNLSGSFTG